MLIQRKMGNVKYLNFIQCFNTFQYDYFLDFTHVLCVIKASFHLKSPVYMHINLISQQIGSSVPPARAQTFPCPVSNTHMKRTNRMKAAGRTGMWQGKG